MHMLILAYTRNNLMRFFVMIGFYDFALYTIMLANYSYLKFVFAVGVCMFCLHLCLDSLCGFDFKKGVRLRSVGNMLLLITEFHRTDTEVILCG